MKGMKAKSGRGSYKAPTGGGTVNKSLTAQTRNPKLPNRGAKGPGVKVKRM